jgi:hypothetical protein
MLRAFYEPQPPHSTVGEPSGSHREVRGDPVPAIILRIKPSNNPYVRPLSDAYLLHSFGSHAKKIIH